jgi:hypothetical protein
MNAHLASVTATEHPSTAGWYPNNGVLQWWDGSEWGATAPGLPSLEQFAASHEEYRWVEMGSLTSRLDDTAFVERMKLATAVLPDVLFSADEPPASGSKVPTDCVWASSPYPGPVPRAATLVSKMSKRFQALGNLRGRTLAEIVAVVGPLAASVEAPDGTSKRTWQQGGFLGIWRVQLKFDRYDVCMGVVTELAV